MQKTPPMVDELEIRHLIQVLSPESHMKLQRMEQRGITFNIHQLRKFLPEEHRQTGKTFFAYSKVCQEFIDSTKDKMEFDVYMYDSDKINSFGQKRYWIDGLNEFIKKYYPELKIEYVNHEPTFEMTLKERYHKEVVVNSVKPRALYVSVEY